MSPNALPGTLHLTELNPSMTPKQLADSLVPPPQFAQASFENYRPNPEYPSQAFAVEVLRAFSAGRPAPSFEAFEAGAEDATATPATEGKRGFLGSLFGSRGGAGKRSSSGGRAGTQPAKPGVYLDGGFGVGKTHLLAALWNQASGRKYFGTFIEYTALVGALGYRRAVEMLQGAALLCIDEFELDDPGDTMVMTRLLGELVDHGTKIAATSNTPPNALGEGRFAAADFLREITAIADRFETLRIDGVDYRKRNIEGSAIVSTDAEIESFERAGLAAGARISDDAFDDVVQYLATVHPSRFVRLVEEVDAVVLRDVRELRDQSDALRLVAFIDRVYDAQLPIRTTGMPLDEVFGGGMLEGGYRKKYLRAMSRIIASTAAPGRWVPGA